MPTCQYCKSKWTWFDSLKNVMSFRKKMFCRYCGNYQYQSKSSRNKISLLVTLPVLLLPFSVVFNWSISSVLLLHFVLIMAVFGILPFFLQLSKHDEPLW
ncbi:MAG TPA: TIGR04104 family putative zinc finger protein [Bacillus sp. (in: firmicutes)]|uniref:TIGR04104 family putative zinc finger protein n=1 Tax=Bacillus litorisediminis TaxID=2922713 RepID=UPI00243520E1|nr:TIGR04104 family putative zinc finger protein [Bacillus litorisediminis]HWO75388.1 TIGR04104 family putative zinc finger protein [Bacillus sp. (in: firmicutes)]